MLVGVSREASRGALTVFSRLGVVALMSKPHKRGAFIRSRDRRICPTSREPSLASINFVTPLFIASRVFVPSGMYFDRPHSRKPCPPASIFRAPFLACRHVVSNRCPIPLLPVVVGNKLRGSCSRSLAALRVGAAVAQRLCCRLLAWAKRRVKGRGGEGNFRPVP